MQNFHIKTWKLSSINVKLSDKKVTVSSKRVKIVT